MSDVVESLRRYVLGWKADFQLAQTPSIWRTLDEWLRHRLRAIQLKHWKRGTTMYRELKALHSEAGASAPLLRGKTRAVLGRRIVWRNRWPEIHGAGGEIANGCGRQC